MTATKTRRLTAVQLEVLRLMVAGWILECHPGNAYLSRTVEGELTKGRPKRESRSVRCDVVHRLTVGEFVRSPKLSGTWHYTLTDAGTAAAKAASA